MSTEDARDTFANLAERIGAQPDTHCWDDDTSSDCWSYSPQLVAELLDAERKRQDGPWRFAGYFIELPSAMSYRLWEQSGDKPKPGDVELYELHGSDNTD